jgi:hypothetical protein
MKKQIILSILCATLFTSLSAYAQSDDVNTVTVVPKHVDMISMHRYPMQADEFYKFKGGYELANGMTVSLYNRGAIMYAKLDNGAPERIVATSRNTFLSTRSEMKLKINLLDNGEANGVVTLPNVAGKVAVN